MSWFNGDPMFAHDTVNVKTPSRYQVVPKNLSARQRDAKGQTIASEQPVAVLNPYV